MNTAIYFFEVVKFYDYDARGCSGGFPCLRVGVSAASEGDALLVADQFFRRQTTWTYPEGHIRLVNRHAFVGDPGQVFALRHESGLSMQEFDQARALGYMPSRSV
jgi:hypothetical protein